MGVAEAEEADRVAESPLEATVALAEVAGAVKDGVGAKAGISGPGLRRHRRRCAHRKVGRGES